jgi:DNA-binding winged helix-turn-helix (wHTH) protein/TolB-like protein
VTQETRFLRFADVEFDVKAGEIRRAGMTTRLEPQPARVLALLVERAGDVVTRAELQQHVWSGDTFVDFERGLNYCIAQIRTALGDSSSSPRFIETLPRRGYRFIAPVQASISDSDDEVPATAEGEADDDARESGNSGGRTVRSRSPWAATAMTVGFWVLLIASAVVVWNYVLPRPGSGGASSASSKTAAAHAAAVAPRSGPVRIAVALFDNDTKRPDYDQLAQTLTDAIVVRLANDTARVTVIGNAPILRQARSFRDVTAIGAALKTEHVILGQVQEIAGRLRVTAHLIRASDEGHVWARRFEPAEGDMPTLDRTVADAVAGAVASKLLGQ